MQVYMYLVKCLFIKTQQIFFVHLFETLLEETKCFIYDFYLSNTFMTQFYSA